MPRRNALGQPVGDDVEWSGAREPRATTLTGSLVDLQPLTPAHAESLFAAVGHDADLWTYQAEEPPVDAAALASLIEAVATRPDVVAFVILDRASRAALGRVSYLRIQPAIGSIEVGGIIYSRGLQRTRAATEVQYLLMRHAFELGFRRYEWKCDSLNQPSRDAALRLGFTEEGTWRNALVTKGRNRDTTWFSLTDAEWPAVRRALEAWLADDNFDAYGVQRRSLGETRASMPSGT